MKKKPGRDEARVPQRDRRDGETVERPKCDCTTGPVTLERRTGMLPDQRRVRFRYVVSISSAVSCDPFNPGKCEYNYTASTEVQQQPLNAQGKPNGPWQPFPRRNVFILKFTVHDDVNHSETPVRVDQTMVTFGLYRPNAPTTENVKVSLVLTISNAGNARFEFDETVQLCVPKGAAPACP